MKEELRELQYVLAQDRNFLDEDIGSKTHPCRQKNTNENEKGFQNVENFSSAILVTILYALADDLDHTWKKSLK